MQRGYLHVGRIRGIPIRLHWSLPLGVLMLSGFRFAPGVWLGITFIILLHELGHAVLVRQQGLVNLGIDITGYGGRCNFTGSTTPKNVAVVAWGGVAAQALLLAMALPLYFVLDPRPTGFFGDLLWSFVASNAIIMAINLLPFPPLDGAKAWPLLGMLWGERRRRRPRTQPVKPLRVDETRWRRREGRDQGAQTLREALEDADRHR